MPIPLGTIGQAEFSQPIELLMDCHRRIEHFLEVLDHVAKIYSSTPLDQQAQEALETSLNYFKQAVPRHTADEEESLFPRLRQSKSRHATQVMSQMDQLEADHRQAELAHDQLDKLGRHWVVKGSLSHDDLQKFQTTFKTLSANYKKHIQLEDKQVFTLASDLLDDGSLSQVGQEMRARCQLNHGRPGSRCAQKRTAALGQTESPNHE